MRISGTGNTRRVASGKKQSKSASAGSAFSLENTSEAAPLHQSSDIASISGVDALLALQGDNQPAAGRRRAMRRGNQMLDLLEDMRIGLLSGQIRPDRLRQLARLSKENIGLIEDPRLSDVLDSIDLRVQVELAKLER